MRSLRRGVVAAVVAVTVVSAGAVALADASASANSGSFTQHTYTTGDGRSRDYWLYVPTTAPAGPRSLVVYLHGCNESALDTAAASHFNDLADRYGFVVVYPQENVTTGSSAPFVDGNGVGCWNWFLPDDQHRDAGEPEILADITRTVVADPTISPAIDPARVYVSGVSAGADMAVILAAAYPDLFAAAAPLAGCAYATCSDESGRLAHNEMGSRARIVPMLVENGSADTLNNMAMAEGLVHGWLGADDLADNGQADGSIAQTPASVQQRYFDQTPQPGSGDVCVHNNTLTCPGGAIGFQADYPTTVETYVDSLGQDVLEFWVLHGMEHAHPDAPGDGPYTDPLGPDISFASYCFFAAHPMSGAPETPEGCPA